jgi:hypothetical protein
MNARRIARALERVVKEADAGTHGIGARLPVRSEEVRRNREELLEVIDRLRKVNGAAKPEGVLLARRLLTDIESPLYQGRADLHAALRTVAAALEADERRD